MTDQQIRKSIETKELQLSILDKFSHFGLIAFLLTVPVAMLFSTIVRDQPGLSYRDQLIVIVLFVLAAFFFYALQKARLKFESIATHLSREEIGALIEEVGNKLEWKPY